MRVRGSPARRQLPGIVVILISQEVPAVASPQPRCTRPMPPMNRATGIPQSVQNPPTDPALSTPLNDVATAGLRHAGQWPFA